MSAQQQQSSSKLPQWVQDHMTAYLLTDGAAGHWYDASGKGGPKIVASLLLTTTGRKSGTELQLPLFYGESPEGVVIVASKGGAPDHPAWYKNLDANPTVKVQVGADKYTARARTITGAKRSELWTLMNKVWPFYDDYQKKTPREIPVVVLERT
jgi:deazaflavin-dependent oxidoreductase (nitroreductase family)